MNSMKQLMISVMLALWLAGCSSVTSENMIGDSTVSLNAEEWDGVWRNQDGALQLKVTDAAEGIFKIAWIEHKADAFRLEEVTLRLTRGKEWNYLNLLEGMDKKDDGYYWGRIEKDRGQILLWMPNADAFAQDVTSGKLRGKVVTDEDGGITGRDVRLEEAGAKIVETIESGGGRYFDWDQPIILIRVN